ncbi:interleukin-12 subunit beta-like [Oncorhynchus kisutch]|uniref:Interleukin-12 subunit beta n=1 Tax=Oncorhynchus kisutch TaxID=8019 RepID=A0A8C7HRE0_ONCKI|nr:interleukin-12 subunit beta-like [Oncorhynchus kisutch]
MFDCCLKMRFTLLSILPTLLGILILHWAKSQSPKFTQSSWNLLPNVVVVNVDGSLVQHPLTCLGSFNREEEGWRRDNDWVWRRDGEEDEEILWMMGGEEKKKGNSFLVNLEERTGGGIFTCHSLDKTLLKNTTVLVKHLDEEKRILEGSTRTGFMKCLTRNYQGEFHCSWKFTPTRFGTVMFVKVARGLSDAENISCSVDASGQQWTCSSLSGQSDIMCSVNSSGLGVSCVDRQYCPYAEETDRITLTIYMRTNYLLEEYSKRFYISEIVKPDNVYIKEVNSSTIEWSYPVSWNRPISYFPLSFQVKEIEGRKCKNGCTCDSPYTEVHTTESSQWSVKAKVTVCVRAQDALCDSPWSDWTEYRLSNKGNKRGRQEKKKKKKKKKKKNVSQ